MASDSAVIVCLCNSILCVTGRAGGSTEIDACEILRVEEMGDWMDGSTRYLSTILNPKIRH